MTGAPPPDDPFKAIAAAILGGGKAPGDDASVLEPADTWLQPPLAYVPPLPKGWGPLGSPVAVWMYLDAEGRELRATLRFEKPDGSGKDIRPATLWKTAGGKVRWRLKSEPGLRPLYRLDALAKAATDAPVLVCEGEKAVAFAAPLFPDWVALTWPGGANAVAKADWSPLRGRVAVVWPDADQAGEKAAQAIRRALAGIADRCGIVELPPGLPKGWDLADQWPDGFNTSDARALIQAALDRASDATEPPPPPEVTPPPGFRLELERGWYRQPPGRSQEGEEREERYVCGPFEVVAEARDPEGLGWSLVVQFTDRDGKRHREVIGRGELAGEGIDVRRRLLDAGLRISTTKAAKEDFGVLLAGLQTSARARLTSACGWHDGRYVLPSGTVGGDGSETVLWKGRPGATYHARAGSYQAWREKVAAPMAGNPIGVLAISCAFAGPLLAKVGGEGGGFHLRGSSSSGKTTALIISGSACGGNGPRGFSQTWRNTSNALEGVALAHSDGLLCLDEIREISPEEAGLAAYSLATGQPKGRMKDTADLRARASWRVLVLSSGEIGLSDLARLSKTRDRSYAGQELRLLDIAADQDLGGGCWADLHGAPSAAEFSEAVKAAALAHYGHALPLFVERFIKREAELLDQLPKLQAEFLDSVLLPSDHGQIRRAAQKFALVAAAGELASFLDVTPWGPGEANAAAAHLFKRWAKAFGRDQTHEDGAAVQIVRAFLQEWEDTGFRKLKADQSDEEALADQMAEESTGKMNREGEARSLKKYGFVGNHPQIGRVFYFNTEAFKSILASFDVIQAARALKKAGYLVTGSDENRLTYKVRIPGEGSSRNFYSVRATILAATD